MAALDFPSTPTNGQTYTANGATWTYDSATTSWLSTNASSGGGATGGSTDQVFYNNDQTVTTNYTIPTGKNSGTFGPVTINSGATVTVSSGSTWTVV